MAPFFRIDLTFLAAPESTVISTICCTTSRTRQIIRFLLLARLSLRFLNEPVFSNSLNALFCSARILLNPSRGDPRIFTEFVTNTITSYISFFPVHFIGSLSLWAYPLLPSPPFSLPLPFLQQSLAKCPIIPQLYEPCPHLPDIPLLARCPSRDKLHRNIHIFLWLLGLAGRV